MSGATRDVLAVFTAEEIFTPTSIAIHNFVARAELEDDLVDALRTPGVQVLVDGDQGVGKSSLIGRKLSETFESHVTTHCDQGAAVMDLVRDVVDQLEPFVVTTTETTRARKRSAGVSGVLLEGSGASLDRSERAFPPSHGLHRLIRELVVRRSAWVLEDAEQLSHDVLVELGDVMRLFTKSGAGDVVPKMVVCGVGLGDQYEEILRNLPPFALARVSVPDLTEQERRALIYRGGQFLRVQFDDEVVGAILKQSRTAAETHHVVLRLLQRAGVAATTEGGWLEVRRVPTPKGLAVAVAPMSSESRASDQRK